MLILFLINKIKIYVPKINIFIFISGLFQFFILFVYRYELKLLNRDVYYSDAEVYWDVTLKLLKNIDAEFYNMGYIYYAYLIQKTSLFISPLLVNISNIMLINLSILILAYLFCITGKDKQNIQVFLGFLLYNPLIYFSLLRNLKDALFLFYVVLVIVITYNLFKNNSKLLKMLYLGLLILLTDLLFNVRPWGFLVPPLLIFIVIYYKFIHKRSLLQKILILSIMTSLVFAVLFISGYYSTLEMWVPIVLDNAFKQSIFSIITSPASLIMGPGPLRAIFGQQYFEFSMFTGNIFSAIGSLMWWIIFPFLIATINIKKIKLDYAAVMLLAITTVFVAIYSMQYGGSAELRFRGILYILITATFLSLAPIVINKNRMVIYGIFCILFFCAGIFMGI